MSEPYGYTIFCDDIREEVGSKLSYMGIYMGSLHVVSAQAVLLPKLAVAMTLVIPSGTSVNTLEFLLRREVNGNEEMLFSANPDSKTPPAAKDRVTKISMNIQLSPFPIDASCILKARANLNGEEVKIGALEVVFKVGSEIAEPAPAGSDQ